jgi:hypothetical protein
MTSARGARSSPFAVIAVSIALFLVVFTLMALQLRLRARPAAAAAAPAPVRRVLQRRFVIRRVIVVVRPAADPAPPSAPVVSVARSASAPPPPAPAPAASLVSATS